ALCWTCAAPTVPRLTPPRAAMAWPTASGRRNSPSAASRKPVRSPIAPRRATARIGRGDRTDPGHRRRLRQRHRRRSADLRHAGPPGDPGHRRRQSGAGPGGRAGGRWLLGRLPGHAGPAEPPAERAHRRFDHGRRHHLHRADDPASAVQLRRPELWP
uniref:Transcriptional regulator, HxlR family n=1 Tax=Parastrongyloides trichosuri TaxID=131310 RepID=A0A0N4Z7G2_PARTI